MLKISFVVNFLLNILLLFSVHTAAEVGSLAEYEKRVMPNRTITDEEAIKNLHQKLISSNRNVYDISEISGISLKCQEDYSHFLNALKSFELWAIKMYDASAKLSSGILSGNVNNAGDLYECLSINEAQHSILGRHCSVQIQLSVDDSLSTPYLAYIHQFVQSFNLMRSKFEDPAHIFGHFSTIAHGWCVPSSCNHRDVEAAARHFADKFTNGTGMSIKVRVPREMCQVEENQNHKNSFNRTSSFTMTTLMFVFLLILGLIASKYNGRNGVLKAFSTKDNWRKLTSLETKSDDIKTIHGIRFVNAILIYLCHKSVEGMLPKSNRTSMAFDASKPESILIRICALYTDVFLMLSGVLVSYSITKSLARGERMSHWKEIISRYIRVMPLIISTILITTFVIPPLAKAKTVQRYLVVEKPAQLCMDYGWRNILMIHNWFKIEDMCNVHTHHVGSDFQLFILAPLLITMLWKSTRVGIYVISALSLVSTLARFYVTYTNDLMYFVSFGARLSQLVVTADLLYTKPPHRFTVYGIGILLGFLLLKLKDFQMSRRQFLIGSIISSVSMLAMIFHATQMININGDYNKMLHSIFSAFAPIIFCSFFAWIIFASQLGHKNFISKFFEWKYFVITTRFCYAFYLIQIPLFQLSFASIREIRHHDPSAIINLNEIVLVIACSIFLTLFIETPFNNLKDIFFKRETLTDQNANHIDDGKKKM